MTMGENTSAGAEWAVRSRYETKDGDRVTLLYGPEAGRFAIFYSYAWQDVPQLIEYTSRLDAMRVFVTSLESAERRGVLARREDRPMRPTPGTEHSPSQVIHEVDWHLRREVIHEAFRRDLAYAHEMGLGVQSWRGEDREGKAMVITWVATDSGRVLSAYEIQGRA